ncbi:hypothetical protein [uncultured Muribaculum sp.]|uniref:hypothetical protein n=1 Tax=uncultured Muribaculum sp. TaxID=1918613 RepID=UPI0025AF2E85|nr:hypothetical protein [uncultured Muribaculum sp.]
MTVVTIMASTDRREHTQPFEKLKRYLARLRIFNLFSLPYLIVFSLSPLAFFALLRNGTVNSVKEYGISE